MQRLYTSDYEGHKRRNPERIPGTCEWLLSHPQYLKWVDKSSSNLLLVSADPGCGKSVLASFLTDKLKSSESEAKLPSTVCSFFFKDDNDEQDNALSALSAILHQLFSAKPQLIRHGLKEFDRKGDKMFNEVHSLWNLLATAIADRFAGNVICIIDGLDECKTPSRNEFVQLLVTFCASCAKNDSELLGLNFLVTSRPYIFIQDQLQQPLIIRLKVEDENDLTSADIELVVRARVESFGRQRRISDAVKNALIDRLTDKAGQTFLWVSFVLADLEQSLRASEKKLNELINQIPKNLNVAYEKMLVRSQNSNDARRLLHIVVGAVRPLSLDEMNIALVIKSEDKDYDSLDLEPDIENTIRNLCGLFVKVVDSKIYLVHQTAKEFLIGRNEPNMGNSNTWQNSLSSVESHFILATICISYLNFTVFEEKPFWMRPSGRYPTRATQDYLANHCFLEYAAGHWALHFRKVQTRIVDTLGDLLLNLYDTQSDRFQIWTLVFVRLESRDRYIRYPLDEYHDQLTLASYLGHEIIVELLLDMGADVNATALPWADVGGRDVVISPYLRGVAKVWDQDINGGNALHMAAQVGHENVIRVLLKNGANIEATAYDGSSALHFAAYKGHEIVVRLLLESGANFEPKNDYGLTPLQIAASKGYDAVVRLLLENGAMF